MRTPHLDEIDSPEQCQHSMPPSTLVDGRIVDSRGCIWPVALILEMSENVSVPNFGSAPEMACGEPMGAIMWLY